MSISRDEAVVLGRLDYSETSQVLVLLTREHGKIRAIAKGIKRGTKNRFAVGIDLLDMGCVLFTNRVERRERLAAITEWTPALGLSGLREKLLRIQAAQYLAEITAALMEDWDPHPEVFDGLCAALRSLADADRVLPAIVAYQALFLEAIGSGPRFDACVRCTRDTDLTHFSSFEGGLVCKHCEPGLVEKRETRLATIATLQGLVGGGSVESVEDDGLSGPFALLNYHLSHLMGREPALARTIMPRRVQSKAG